MSARLALVLLLASSAARAAGPSLALPVLTPERVQAFTSAQEEAQDAVASKDWAKAERAYKTAARIHGGNEGLWYNLACVQALQGKTSAAMSSLEQARKSGWDDDRWPTKDSDLTSLHDLPAFRDWLTRVAAAKDHAAQTASAPLLATSADEIEKEAAAAQEKLDAVEPVLGPTERMRASDAIRTWKLASWDAIAASSTEDSARETAEWSALESLLRKDLQPAEDEQAATIATRADAFAHAHPASSHSAEARFAAASARRLKAMMDAKPEESDAAGAAEYERELLRIAASETEGRGLQLALARLISLSDEDVTTARGYAERLRKLIGDDAKYADLMLNQARGMHYRLAGLPSFEAVTLDGRKVTPDSLRGKVTLIDFWATWCGPCRGELPHLKDAYAKFKDRGFEIVGVSLDPGKGGDHAAFDQWCSENGVTWPQVFDGKFWDAALAKTFGVKSIPFPLLIGRDGRVVYADEQLRGEQLLSRIESVLEPPVGM